MKFTSTTILTVLAAASTMPYLSAVASSMTTSTTLLSAASHHHNIRRGVAAAAASYPSGRSLQTPDGVLEEGADMEEERVVEDPVVNEATDIKEEDSDDDDYEDLNVPRICKGGELRLVILTVTFLLCFTPHFEPIQLKACLSNPINHITQAFEVPVNTRPSANPTRPWATWRLKIRPSTRSKPVQVELSLI